MKKLTGLGWDDFFATQLDGNEPEGAAPYRVSEVQRSRITLLSPDGAHSIPLHGTHRAGDFAVGDWVLADIENSQIFKIFERKTVISRLVAGTERREQLIAANIDTLFIVTACGLDVNIARLERYLALAYDSGAIPVLILTKVDLDTTPTTWADKLHELLPDVSIIAVDARHDDLTEKLKTWLQPGKTIALVGTSGVGKTTIVNSLTGLERKTLAVREKDDKGQHTTTARSLHATSGHAWIIDTPGMRELQLVDSLEGIDQVFDDILVLTLQCRFNNCKHDAEPGCAVREALESKSLDSDRLKRWQKLQKDDQRQTETIAQSRKKFRAIGKMSKKTQKAKKSKS